MATPCLHNRHDLSGKGSCFWPSLCPDRHWTCATEDCPRDCIFSAQYACIGDEETGTGGVSSIQRGGHIRGHCQCRGTSRLLDIGKQDPPVHVRGPHGDPVARRIAEQPDFGSYAPPAGDTERIAYIVAGPCVGGRHRGGAAGYSSSRGETTASRSCVGKRGCSAVDYRTFGCSTIRNCACQSPQLRSI